MSKTAENPYRGLTPAEALRKLNKRFIRKQECKDMLCYVADYIETLEHVANKTNVSESQIDLMNDKIVNLDIVLRSVEKSIDEKIRQTA